MEWWIAGRLSVEVVVFREVICWSGGFQEGVCRKFVGWSGGFQESVCREIVFKKVFELTASELQYQHVHKNDER